jgi:circadian clock protein KaiB
MKRNERDSVAEFEQAIAESKAQVFVLRLYVSGSTPRSTEAIRNIKQICEEHLAGQYDLQVFDIYQQPEVTSAQQILAAPTLVKESPGPLRRLIGNLSDTKHILQRLGLMT